MRRRMHRFPFLAALTGVLVSMAAVPAAGQSALDRVRERYERAAGFEARFEQADDEGGMRGTLWLQGEKYRLEAGSRTIVTDGRTVWVHDRSENRVVISDLVEDETTFSIPAFLYRFDERWRVSGTASIVEEGQRVQVVTLLPIDPEDWFTGVTVAVRESDWTVTRISVTDAADATMTFRLGNVVERPLDASLFRLEIPRGVEVVDLRG